MPDPIEKFQGFWRTLTTEEQSDLYLLFSAIRGPDQQENLLRKGDLELGPVKDIYTRPIRKLLFGEDYEKIFSQDRGVYPLITADHFSCHAQLAESVLKLHGFKKEEIVHRHPVTGLPILVWSKSKQQTVRGRGTAVIPLPKISIAGSEVEVAVHLRMVPAKRRRGT